MSADKLADALTDQAVALTILADHGVPPDVQELLCFGNPKIGVKPKALRALIAAFPQPNGELLQAARTACAFYGGLGRQYIDGEAEILDALSAAIDRADRAMALSPSKRGDRL